MLKVVLRCPKCERGRLRAGHGGHVCEQCSARYPMPRGPPWLFADPRGAAAAWRARLTLLLGELRREAAACGAAITADVSSRTRERLGLLEAAYGDHADRLAGLLEPFGTGTAAASHDTLQALRTRLPGSRIITPTSIATGHGAKTRTRLRSRCSPR